MERQGLGVVGLKELSAARLSSGTQGVRERRPGCRKRLRPAVFVRQEVNLRRRSNIGTDWALFGRHAWGVFQGRAAGIAGASRPRKNSLWHFQGVEKTVSGTSKGWKTAGLLPYSAGFQPEQTAWLQNFLMY